MKKILVLLLFLPMFVAAQSTDQNYVKSTSFTDKYDVNVVKNNPTSVLEKDKIETITYFDGLGRPMQSIGVRAGGDGKDIITHIGYDDFGRHTKDYLPYAAVEDGGSYRTNALSATNSFYDATKYNDDFPGMTTANINPYSEKHLENSPLGRVLEQGAPGAPWAVNKTSNSDHTIKFDYKSNTSTDVRLYMVSLSFANKTYTPTLTGGTSYYSANTLYKTITKDENWTSGTNHTTEEFKDKNGRVILKRTYNSGAHDTYYVYDDYGNLTYVLPPKSEPHSAKPDSVELSELCYQYKYDYRNRLVEKKIPGKGWEYIVYDNLDRPVLTQDANQKAKSPDQWLFTKYDALGRVVYTGLINDNATRAALQTAINGITTNYVNRITSPISLGGATLYYSNGAYPVSNISEILTVNYYDDYEIGNQVTFNPGPGITWEGMVISLNTKGLSTVTKVRVLGTNNWVTTAMYYDAKGRVWETHIKNEHLGTDDWILDKLDFVGKVEKNHSVHMKSGQSNINTVDTFTYDNMGRLLSQKQKINSQAEEQIVVNSYDNLGQLESKGVGSLASSGTRLQIIDYKYNIRGWLKEINDPTSIGTDLFAFKIKYDEGSNALYNGNISSTQWKTANTDASLKTYNYTYDALNRIKSAIDNTAKYNLVNVSYDKNGNITNLNRKGHTNLAATSFGTMDNLVYTYESRSNKLKQVLDNGNDTYGFKDSSVNDQDYWYDENGNMTKDDNKGITAITYNHLNLPTQVTFSNGNIQYIYDAAGTKLRKTVIESGKANIITKYAGNYIYKKTGSAADVLEFFSHAEGYTKKDGSSFDYVYQYKDHLGNIRLSYSDSNNNGSVTSSEIVEENNYYPFGLSHKGYNNNVSSNGNATAQKRKFGGKELQDELGLEWYDITARNYDPALGRWMNLDPLAEKGRRHSPYNFAFDNPIRFVDYDGMWPDWGGVLDAVQTGLDVAGMIPGLGNVADVANAGISGGRAVYALATGDTAGAKEHGGNLAMSMAAAIPGAGLAVGAAKITKTIVKSVKAGKKAKATLKTVNKATKNRVKLRKGVKKEVLDSAPKTKSGDFIDPNTGKIIPKDGPYDIGHKTGQEWKTRKKMHDKKGSTRKEVIEAENDPNLYQVEDPKSNRSHKYEK